MKKDLNNTASGLAAFIETSVGVSDGTLEQSAAIKKKYWADYRRNWKKKRREECKTFEIFYTESEFKQLRTFAGKQHVSITKFIKFRSLHDLASSPIIAGRVRELLINMYAHFEILLEKQGYTEQEIEDLLKNMVRTEENILALLQ